MLADGHRPDGFDQRVAGIPRVDSLSRLAKSGLGRCFPEDFHIHTHI